MDVTFETPAGRRFTVDVWYFDTVREMKEKIHKHEGIPVESQRLFFQGQELADDRDTEHYAILQGSHVVLLLPPDSPSASTPEDVASSARTVSIHVTFPTVRRHFTLELNPAGTTVSRLKELIQEQTDGVMPATRQVLLFDKTELQDQKTLAEYNPPDKMEVSVILGQPPPPQPGNAGAKKQPRMAVTVKFGAVTVSVDVCSTGSVGELRKELGRVAPERGMQLPAEGGYFFVYKQNVMEDNRTLRWHDVKNGDTIEIFNGSVTAD